MSIKYGKFLDQDEPFYQQQKKFYNRDPIYSIFTEYFDNISLTKIKQHENLGVWMARINSLLKKGYHYLIVIVQDDYYSPGDVENLSNLRWTCLQTKNLEEYHDIPKQGYTMKRDGKFNSKINISDRNKNRSEYKCPDIPGIKITLVHSKGIEYEFPNSGSLNTALETFKTIITFDE